MFSLPSFFLLSFCFTLYNPLPGASLAESLSRWKTCTSDRAITQSSGWVQGVTLWLLLCSNLLDCEHQPANSLARHHKPHWTPSRKCQSWPSPIQINSDVGLPQWSYSCHYFPGNLGLFHMLQVADLRGNIPNLVATWQGGLMHGIMVWSATANCCHFTMAGSGRRKCEAICIFLGIAEDDNREIF